MLKSRVETNTNNREYSIVLVVFVNIILVPNTCYIILWEFLHKNKSVNVIKCTSINRINLRISKTGKISSNTK